METPLLLDGGGCWIIRMILKMEEDTFRTVSNFFARATFDVFAGIDDCFFEDGKNVLPIITAGHEPAVK